ncbi:extracellular solute-binding protein [Herbiconiux moechotypicola]|uniref:Extracellular solute-binding protein n=1 Tax=Herbiconiux moechotypicola TaxID=637393 RepID=A0ABN3DRC7_9MICO|nr:extracellular solute-binding protein [Herbiconiux moechotypicola]MCS5731429.1 extracellular solute-binding protein [Herbiconiux moechotypicola]
MRRGIIRNAAAGILAATLAVTAAGCAGGSSDTGDGSTELEFWTFIDPASADDPRGAALKQIVDDYNAQSDGVTVTVRSINYAKLDAEVIKATASGSGPDILNVYSNQLPTHVAAKTVLPMTEYAQPVLDELGDDFLFPVDGVTFDGEIMAMPWEIRAWLLWYRADLLEQAGLSVPTTLDELGTTAAALQKTGVTGLGIGFSNAGLGADFMEKFIPFTWGNGGEILDDGEAVFDNAAGVATMDYFTQLKDEGAFGDEVLSMGADEVVNGVKAGTIAMAIEGSYRVAAARSGDGIGENLQTVPMVSDDASTPLDTPVAGQTLAIGANASDQAAAWDFIQYYTSAQSQEAFAAAGVLPVLSSVYESAAVQELPNAAELAGWRDYILEHGRPNPVAENFSELSDSLVTGAQRVVFEGADASETLTQVATDFNSK